MPRDRRYGGRTSIGDLELYEGGYTPWERAGQVALSRTPEAFSYGSLEEKYPTRQVMPMVPSYIQNKLDEENLVRKSNEVALRIREAQLNTLDSKLNEDKAIAEQVIQARPEFASLNPQDPDYQEKRDQLFIKYPLLEDSREFMAGTVARLDRINERYINKIKPPTSRDAYKDYEDAYKNVNALRQAKDKAKGEYTKEDEIFESLQVQKMDQAMARMGAMNQPAPQQQRTQQPSMPSTTSALNFNTPEEANAAEINGLIKRGDRITVGGRPAIVK